MTYICTNKLKEKMTTKAEFKSVYQRVAECNNLKGIQELVAEGKCLEYCSIERKYTEFREVTETILEFVAAKSKTFAADVAKKTLEFGRCSDKQAWVVAYEFMAIKDKLFSEFVADQPGN